MSPIHRERHWRQFFTISDLIVMDSRQRVYPGRALPWNFIALGNFFLHCRTTQPTGPKSNFCKELKVVAHSSLYRVDCIQGVVVQVEYEDERLFVGSFRCRTFIHFYYPGFFAAQMQCQLSVGSLETCFSLITTIWFIFGLGAANGCSVHRLATAIADWLALSRLSECISYMK